MDTIPQITRTGAVDLDIPVLWLAPQKVKDAWCANPDYTEIALHPRGYTTMDSCGCCFTEHPPGWYLGILRRTISFEYVQWSPICAPDGGEIGPSHYFDLLDCD